MDEVLFGARAVLAAIFIFAALAKATSQEQAAATLREFSLPQPLAKIAAYGLPIAELAIGVLLVPTATASVAATAAFILLTCFSIVIAANLLRGKRPSCNCFGQAKVKPIGPRTLVRNVSLMLIAALPMVLGGGELGIVAMLSKHLNARVAFDAVAVLVAAFLCWMVLQLFKQQGRLLVRIDNLQERLDRELGPAAGDQLAESYSGLSVGTPAPSFAMRSLSGASVTLADLLSAGNPLLLVFVDPQCAPCAAFVPRIQAWQAPLQSKLRIAVVSRGGVDENMAKYGALGPANVLLQEDREISNQYKMLATPSAVALSAAGTVLFTAAVGDAAIEKLVGQIAVNESLVSPERADRATDYSSAVTT